MFILIVGSKIHHCSLQPGSENSLLHLWSSLPSSLFLLLLLYLSFFFSINRLFFFYWFMFGILYLWILYLMFLYLVLMETGEENWNGWKKIFQFHVFVILKIFVSYMNGDWRGKLKWLRKKEKEKNKHKQNFWISRVYDIGNFCSYMRILTKASLHAERT